MESKTVEIPVSLYEDLSELGEKHSLTPDQIANQLLEREMKRKQEQEPTQKTKSKPNSLKADLKNHKVTWTTPKGTFALATLIDDIHFKRLRRWMNKKTPLELVTNSPGNELMIINRELVDQYNARAKCVNVELDAALVEEAKKLNVNIEEAASRHFKNVKRAYP